MPYLEDRAFLFSPMRIVYFDTETTGLSPMMNLFTGYEGQICQLAYAICDGDETVAKNFFFRVNYVEPSASQITGLTVELLNVLSEGKVFADYADEIHEDFASADFIVSHNFSFDKKFMEAEFTRLDMNFDYKRSICSMRSTVDYLKLPGRRGNMYKLPSLQELGSFFGISDYEVIETAKRLYNSSSVAHDARFDTVKLMLAVEVAKKECPALLELN